MGVKRIILYIFTFVSASYPFVIAMNNGYEWGEFFRDLIVCFAIAFVCHTLAGVLAKLERIENDKDGE